MPLLEGLVTLSCIFMPKLIVFKSLNIQFNITQLCAIALLFIVVESSKYLLVASLCINSNENTNILIYTVNLLGERSDFINDCIRYYLQVCTLWNQILPSLLFFIDYSIFEWINTSEHIAKFMVKPTFICTGASSVNITKYLVLPLYWSLMHTIIYSFLPIYQSMGEMYFNRELYAASAVSIFIMGQFFMLNYMCVPLFLPRYPPKSDQGRELYTQGKWDLLRTQINKQLGDYSHNSILLLGISKAIILACLLKVSSVSFNNLTYLTEFLSTLGLFIVTLGFEQKMRKIRTIYLK